MGGSAGETPVRALESLLLSDRRNEPFRECPRFHVAAQFTPSVSFIKRMSSARINSEFNIAFVCCRRVRVDLTGASPSALLEAAHRSTLLRMKKRSIAIGRTPGPPGVARDYHIRVLSWPCARGSYRKHRGYGVRLFAIQCDSIERVNQASSAMQTEALSSEVSELNRHRNAVSQTRAQSLTSDTSRSSRHPSRLRIRSNCD
jgi:hypothetical protein